ncbi:DUF2800 domain-containing protein [Butyrivibrio proteoclasticus]|uniref:DUF2800 domain-containing protein n=1 Tax=Butyrivibrio proteoclasticus TaxID=43305 RepID=UPI00047B3559|nr:DUF2800 domain-containing protein [Butyrivibrio proteoclasticus]
MAKHALLPPSSAKRWTECTPSALLNQQAEDTPSQYAEEGTQAHLLCSYLLEREYGIETKDPTESLSYYSQEMQDCAEIYLQTVNEIMAEVKKTCPDPAIFIEQKVDFSKWVPEGFGTADCIILADGITHVCDYKHGVGVFVDAIDNIQMKCYALGVISMFGDIYDFDEICMHIIQPRKENISSWSINVSDLLTWADDFLAVRAQLAIKGEGEFVAGSHCQFCKVKATCRKRAEANLELAKHEFKLPETLSNTEISVVLGKVDDLVSWANDVKDYALSEALNGKKFEGYKVVEGRSLRKYSDVTAVADAVTSAGFDPYKKEVIGISAMETLLGKKKFQELLGDYVVKPQGKPVLVSINDKRPEFNSAAEDFKEKGEQ